jgi:lipoprotein-anchoring transpeptidase ErfK/SrfK
LETAVTRLIPLVLTLLLVLPPNLARASNQTLSADAVASAAVGDGGGNENRAALIKAAILLDRARFSPGLIDGLDGENVQSAIRAFQAATGLAASGTLDTETMNRLIAGDGESLLTEYTILKDDVKGPFNRKLPTKMEQQAKLSRLNYGNATELLAEKFHLSEDLLKALNKGKRLDRANTKITVPAVRAGKTEIKAARLEVNKSDRVLRAFDSEGKLIAHYPASVGSEEKPAPTGTVKVTRIAKNPNYTYNPKYNFKGVKTNKGFTINPGPNNPVGLVWIALEGDGYGIHGTPQPEKVAKSASHGCVRLTNWDALELAGMVDKGTPVEFIE